MEEDIFTREERDSIQLKKPTHLNSFIKFIKCQQIKRRLELLQAFFVFRLLSALILGIIYGALRLNKFFRFVLLIFDVVCIMFGPPVFGSVFHETDYLGLVHNAQDFFADKMLATYFLFAIGWGLGQLIFHFDTFIQIPKN